MPDRSAVPTADRQRRVPQRRFPVPPRAWRPRPGAGCGRPLRDHRPPTPCQTAARHPPGPRCRPRRRVCARYKDQAAGCRATHRPASAALRLPTAISTPQRRADPPRRRRGAGCAWAWARRWFRTGERPWGPCRAASPADRCLRRNRDAGSGPAGRAAHRPSVRAPRPRRRSAPRPPRRHHAPRRRSADRALRSDGARRAWWRRPCPRCRPKAKAASIARNSRAPGRDLPVRSAPGPDRRPPAPSAWRPAPGRAHRRHRRPPRGAAPPSRAGGTKAPVRRAAPGQATWRSGGPAGPGHCPPRCLPAGQ